MESIPPPVRSHCEPDDVLAYLENRLATRLRLTAPGRKRNKVFIRPAGSDSRVHVIFSSGKRYATKHEWFFKIREDTLLTHDFVAIWSDWTQTGWLIPSSELYGFIKDMPASISEGPKRWDPRIAIKEGEARLWTHEKLGYLPVSGFRIDFGDGDHLFADDPANVIAGFDPLEVVDLEGHRPAAADLEELPEALIARGIRDQRNRELGFAGEMLVVNMERARLTDLGMHEEAKAVTHVARQKGSDSRGYDILSFDERGRDKLIEVKTTRGVLQTPFFLSRNEIKVADKNPNRWKLVRVFEFGGSPKAFEVRPPLDRRLHTEPVSFMARLRPGWNSTQIA